MNMGCKKLKCCSMTLVLLLLIIVLPSLSPLQFMAQGRQVKELDMATLSAMRTNRRIAIGSRPPRCSERCKNCGHCEAVQVPIVPINKSLQKYNNENKANTNVVRFPYARGDGISNYKPMCWKCKCGDFFFNPW